MYLFIVAVILSLAPFSQGVMHTCAKDEDCGSYAHCPQFGTCACNDGYVEDEGSCFINGFGVQQEVNEDSNTQATRTTTEAPDESSSTRRHSQTTHRSTRRRTRLRTTTAPSNSDSSADNTVNTNDDITEDSTPSSNNDQEQQQTRRTSSRTNTVRTTTSAFNRTGSLWAQGRSTTQAPPAEQTHETITEDNSRNGDGKNGDGATSNGDGNRATTINTDSSVSLNSLSETTYVNTPCSNLPSNDFCGNNGSCFESDSPEINWCMCPDEFMGINCQNRKPLSIPQRKTLSDVNKTPSKRYVNRNNPKATAIGHHKVQNEQQCLRLCEMSGGSCQSFNYGRVRNENICELLALKALTDDQNPVLKSWVVDASDWSYFCCVSPQ